MAATIEALPDDPDMLKAMLLAERAESERLRLIIKELQRHRFGRRAESLPEEQLQLGLEEAEQVEAAGQAETEGEASAERKTRAARRRANRGALPAHLPRIETVVDVASTICPGCSGTLHRIGEDVAERLSPRCWCQSMPIIFRFTARPRFTPARASIWIARRWPTGWGAQPSCCGQCMSDCSTD